MAIVKQIKGTNNVTYDIGCDWSSIDNLPYNFENLEDDCIKANTLHLGESNGEGGKIVFGNTDDVVEIHDGHFACIEEISNDELNFKASRFNFEIHVENGGSEFRVTGGPIIVDADQYIEGNLSGNADTATYAENAAAAECDLDGNVITDTYLKLKGGNMTGTIVTPGDDSKGIYPATDNYGFVGSSTNKFYKMYATTFFGNLSGNASSATSVRSDTTTSAYYLCGSTNATTNTSGILVKRSNVYVDASGYLYSGGAKVLTAGDGDTKNTVGATTTTSKIYLVGVTASGANPQSYTNLSTFISGNYLYSGGSKVLTSYSDTNVTNNTTTSTYYLCGSTSSGNTTGTLGKRTTVYVDTSGYLNVTGNIYAKNGIVYASSGFYETSDERLKDFSNKIDVDLDKISKIKKHRFTWKGSENKNEEIGVSAQEIRELYPEIVSENEYGYLSVSYDKLAIVALAAIDELHKKNKELEARIELLESKLLN